MQVFQRITIVREKFRNLCAFSSAYLHLEWDSALFGIWIWFSNLLLRKGGCSQNITTQRMLDIYTA